MGLLDYHAKNLLPAVWSPDGDLTARFRAQIEDQMDRFPGVQDILLVGDTVSHYWQDDSEVDVLLLVPEERLKEARQQARRVSGFPLVETDNRVNFWPIKAGYSPGVLAQHFGPVHSVNTGYWYGQHVQNEMELQRTAGVLQHANWRLWKAKYREDPFPYEWRILAEAFSHLSVNERNDVLDELRYRTSQIDRHVTKLLKHQSRETWRAAEQFDQELIDTEELPEDSTLPRRVVLALLHRFRYQDLLDTLIEVDDKLQQVRYAAAEEEPSVPVLRQQFMRLADMILQRTGGSAKAVEQLYALLRFILDNSQYILTDMRRRRIVYRLYRYYFGGDRNGEEN